MKIIDNRLKPHIAVARLGMIQSRTLSHSTHSLGNKKRFDYDSSFSLKSEGGARVALFQYARIFLLENRYARVVTLRNVLKKTALAWSLGKEKTAGLLRGTRAEPVVLVIG